MWEAKRWENALKEKKRKIRWFTAYLHLPNSRALPRSSLPYYFPPNKVITPNVQQEKEQQTKKGEGVNVQQTGGKIYNKARCALLFNNSTRTTRSWTGRERVKTFQVKKTKLGWGRGREIGLEIGLVGFDSWENCLFLKMRLFFAAFTTM